MLVGVVRVDGSSQNCSQTMVELSSKKRKYIRDLSIFALGGGEVVSKLKIHFYNILVLCGRM